MPKPCVDVYVGEESEDNQEVQVTRDRKHNSEVNNVVAAELDAAGGDIEDENVGGDRSEYKAGLNVNIGGVVLFAVLDQPISLTMGSGSSDARTARSTPPWGKHGIMGPYTQIAQFLEDEYCDVQGQEAHQGVFGHPTPTPTIKAYDMFSDGGCLSGIPKLAASRERWRWSSTHKRRKE
ncbi:hypothetical protein NM208_g8770 [Fusarium decemcellulare]|uniref:Uncharacterized protein n=1 Tax=Fusarium decemcellulare TaxID=57161 RepID=A0ACC1S404_9HYPO|nr:hypothetical protein NM208_g8770 [Fusarium decemcellulare]